MVDRCDSEIKLEAVQKIRNNLGNYKVVEKNLNEFATEGASAKYYYDEKGELVLIDMASFVSLARFFTSYYISSGSVFFINSVSEEWDLKKLHGENGELSSTEGEYVVATSTREGYIISNSVLCKYIAEKQREASPAVTKSDPVKDSKELLKMFEEIKNK